MILSSPMYGPNDLPPTNRKRPKKKLSLEQEFLLIMRSRLGLLQEDLAWRFQVSDTTAPKVITTWVKLLSKEFGCLIICPSKGQICATPPVCFKNIYLKTKVIINCTEMFAQTPSSLEVQSLLWSEYKHHCTFKLLICITPSGAISWTSPAYGGGSDRFIVLPFRSSFQAQLLACLPTRAFSK